MCLNKAHILYTKGDDTVDRIRWVRMGQLRDAIIEARSELRDGSDIMAWLDQLEHVTRLERQYKDMGMSDLGFTVR